MKAYEYIEKGWCQNVYARDKNGHIVDGLSTVATQWCVLGAINASTNAMLFHRDGEREEMMCRYQEMLTQHLRLNRRSLSSWNDDPSRTQSHVVSALKVCDI